jgi:hypothetical protein
MLFNWIESFLLSAGKIGPIGSGYLKWAKDLMETYRKELLDMSSTTKLEDILAKEKLLKDAEGRLKGWLKTEPYVSTKRACTLVLGIVLGLYVANQVGLDMFKMLNLGIEVPATVAVWITGLVIGTGSAPVHSLIGILQKSRDAIDGFRALKESEAAKVLQEFRHLTSAPPAAPPGLPGARAPLAPAKPLTSDERRAAEMEALRFTQTMLY